MRQECIPGERWSELQTTQKEVESGADPQSLKKQKKGGGGRKRKLGKGGGAGKGKGIGMK